MKLDRVMIAAPKSGSGKTTITCAILQTLKDMGKQVVSYKCGPDYIDPMFHQRVIGIPSKNLDTFFTGENDTRKLLLKNRTGEEIAVIEGVMGLYKKAGAWASFVKRVDLSANYLRRHYPDQVRGYSAQVRISAFQRPCFYVQLPV